MSQSVSRTANGVRPHFDLQLAPVPHIRASQWDFGDMTSRALIAWQCVREVLGDAAGDPDLEAGLWQHLRSCLHPDTGLAFVPDHSDPAQGQYYYHMWDQGMVFYHLVQRFHRGDAEALPWIRRLQQGLIALARRDVLHDRQGIPGLVPDFSRVLWWPTDCFWNDANTPLPNRDFGKMHWTNFTPVAGVLLRPQAMLAGRTNDPNDLELALELAGGFLCGFQEQRGSTSPTFDEHGRFKGHFHGTITGVIGLVVLGRHLLGHGEPELGCRYVELAARVYRWAACDTISNPNRACSCGYFPETAGYGPRAGVSGVSELCCTADMIELACELAACADLDPQWTRLADLWSDVERFTINQVFQSQFTDPARLRARLPDTDADHALERLRGSWIGLRSFPNDLGWYRRTDGIAVTVPQEQAAQSSRPIVACLIPAGCCAYSAVRALAAAWRMADRFPAVDRAAKRTTREKAGTVNFLGLWPDVKPNDTPTYELTYEGSKLVRIEPAGLKYPFLEGL